MAVIDRGRIEYDEAANDVGAVLVNYIALGLRGPRLHGPARALSRRFLDEYVSASADSGIDEVLPVHTAMRVAAVASPTFYPEVSDRARVATLAAGVKIAGLPRLGLDNLGACFDELMELS